MKKIYLLLWLAIFSQLTLKAQQDTILIDFGDPMTTSLTPWNNMSSAVSGTTIEYLINAKGVETSIGVSVYDSFGGYNTGGTQTPDETLDYPISATRDSYYGCDVAWGTILEPTGGIEFTGLNPEITYTFNVFASRGSTSDNRETQYVFAGLVNDTLYLDPANNTGNTVSTSLKPKADGTLKLEASPGPNNTNANGFYYLGALKVVYDEIAVTTMDTVLVDFGDPGITSPTPWNNLTGYTEGAALSHMLNRDGLITPLSISVYDAFGGINTGGTDAPDESLNMPATATRDSYYGCTTLFGTVLEPTGGLEISGLDPNKAYTMEMFASRMSATDNRETRYVFSGITQDTSYLDPVGNTSQTVSVTLKPKADGTIRMDVSPGPNNNNSSGFYYTGALRIIYAHDDSPQIIVTTPNGGELWQPLSTHDITWVSQGLTEDIALYYSTDNGANWNLIDDAVDVAQTTYSWDVPNISTAQCLVKVASGAVADISDNVFSISVEHLCNIVVLGSSTAAGTGTSVSDSAWVNRYRVAIQENSPGFDVINLAIGGYTTFQILPTGTTLPDGVNESIDVNHNVTKALSYNPCAIIINMPSNDATKYYDVQMQLDNYKIISDLASEAGIKVWIATPQPRNFSDPVQTQIQFDLFDTLPDIYGDYTIDFWTDIADENGRVVSDYDAGDGIHLNNAGHRILFERVLAKQIDTLPCSPVGVSETSATQSQVKVYPNPYNTQFTLEVETQSAGQVNVVLFDALGRELYNESRDIDSPGIHALEIEDGQVVGKTAVIFGFVTVTDIMGTRLSQIKLVKVK